MVRLPVVGIAVAFLAFVFASASAIADPITVGAKGFDTTGKSLISWVAPEDAAHSAYGGGNMAAETPAGGRFFSLNLGSRRHFDSDDDGDEAEKPPSVWMEGFMPPGIGLSHATPNGVPFDFSSTTAPVAMPAGAPVAFVPSVAVPGSGSTMVPSLTPGAFSSSASSTASASSAVSAKGFGSAGGSFGGAAAVVTPEPASLLLLGSGLAALALRTRSRKRR